MNTSCIPCNLGDNEYECKHESLEYAKTVMDLEVARMAWDSSRLCDPCIPHTHYACGNERINQ